MAENHMNDIHPRQNRLATFPHLHRLIDTARNNIWTRPVKIWKINNNQYVINDFTSDKTCTLYLRPQFILV